MHKKTFTVAICLALSPAVGIAAEQDGIGSARPGRDAATTESGKPSSPKDDVPAAEPSTEGVRVPYIPEPVKREIIEQLRPSVREEVVQEILKQARQERWGMPDAFPAWVNRIAFFGDLRLRAQVDKFADGNAANFFLNTQRINQARNFPGVETYLNTAEDQQNMRLRMRLGMLAKVSDSVDGVVRLSTGSTNNPVSTNYTFSNGFSSAQLVLDQGYLRYQSEKKAVSIWGGRMANPFLSTDLVWDHDVNFDGVATTSRRVAEGAAATVGTGFLPFITLGAFPLQTTDRGRDDKWLYATQLGFDWGFSRSKLSIGAAYYRF